MPQPKVLDETALAGLASDSRKAAGVSRAQAARDMKVSKAAIQFAEEDPQRSMTQLRRRMIEAYSPYRVEGPVYLLKRKR